LSNAAVHKHGRASHKNAHSTQIMGGRYITANGRNSSRYAPRGEDGRLRTNFHHRRCQAFLDYKSGLRRVSRRRHNGFCDVCHGGCKFAASAISSVSFLSHPPRRPFVAFVRRILNLNKKHPNLQVNHEENHHKVPSASQTGEGSHLYRNRREFTTTSES
jgi:hypothetical protein